jgi:Ca2+-transporting ATPase
MLGRIGIQTIAIAGVTLSAYLIGLRLFPEMARTMAFATVSFSELLRAFTSRSLQVPLLQLGLFSNRPMFAAVVASAVMLLLVIYLPIAQPIFNTVSLGLEQWRFVFPLLLVPALVAELSKLLLGRLSLAGQV